MRDLDDLSDLNEKLISVSLEDVTPRERYSLVVKNRLARSMNELRKKELEGSKFIKCKSCFLVRDQYCICSDLLDLSKKANKIEVFPKIRFLILINDRELFKSSNTGKLIKMLIPDSELLIHGITKDNERLCELISSNSGKYNKTVILFPDNKSSVNLYDCLDNFYSKHIENIGKNFGVDAVGNSKNRHEYYCNLHLNVILIDGTWSQAKSINKFLPKSIPRVVIKNKKISDFGPLRKQNKEGNISTVEAASLLLINVGKYMETVENTLINEADVNFRINKLNHKNFEVIANLLGESLNILITNVIAQCKREYLRDILNERNKKRFQK
ncbi:hypothetical protein FG386_000489 [Cryptosporidium ryanae]|uniref:uncharacterized protein n=1 Tax=Cryptosporidium ryanae TaxID=515981 RepID=UPI003519FC94|nr:hypothetical protein FG386_000489 [Cryptosporidium ryanae]